MKLINTIFLLIIVAILNFLDVTFLIIPALNASSTLFLSCGIGLIVLTVYLDIILIMKAVSSIKKWIKYKKRLKDIIDYEEV